MRLLPTQQYCGLTIVLSNQSRFDRDNKSLLTAYAGHYFNEDCLRPAYLNRWKCDIRTADSKSLGLLPDTRGLLLLGDTAFREWTVGYNDYTLNEQRGYVLNNEWNLPCIASYFPQDAMDIQDYESRIRESNQSDEGTSDSSLSGIGEDNEDEDDTNIKRHGKTRRSNYRFWLQRDTKKICYCIKQGRSKTSDYTVKVYPNSLEVIKVLSEASGILYLDIETDLVAQNLFCLGFSLNDEPIIYVVPFLRFDYSVAYSDYYNIFRALSKALRKCIIVVHNAMFDLCVLSFKYSLPLPKNNYDTMLSQHRCFPEAEHSLGHSLSAWPEIHEAFHKDEGVFPPHNIDQELKLWHYNAKDVWALKLIRKAQLDYAKMDTGLMASITQSNKLIYSYIRNTLHGIPYDTDKVSIILKECDRLMTHYLRAIRMLVGYDILPSSPTQCRKYFFQDLGYKSVMKTKPSKKHPEGQASTGEKALQKLKLKYPLNFIIDLMLVYRERSKEAGMLKFEPLP